MEDELVPGDAVLARTFARELDLDPKIVNRWRTRGYLNDDGERVYVEPRGEIRHGTRVYPVYLWADLAEAERATRHKGGRPRRNPILAADQRRHRAQAA